ncbi:MAG: signal peptidase I [Clostridiales bacterium]|nr:signal peptidase I [Clostridiales bacterium]
MEEQKEISETGTKGIGAKQENEGVLKTVADFVSTFVVTIVVIIAILLVIGRFTGIHLFNVESGSMTPEYPVGTLLIDKETDPSLIEQGDVVTFIMNEEGMLVTHRVVSIDRTDKTFTTKGDANNVAVMRENETDPALVGRFS